MSKPIGLNLLISSLSSTSLNSISNRQCLSILLTSSLLALLLVLVLLLYLSYRLPNLVSNSTLSVLNCKNSLILGLEVVLLIALPKV